MKKIIATVLAMVMALALCTTAFAATSYTDAYKWNETDKKWEKVDLDGASISYTNPTETKVDGKFSSGTRGYYSVTLKGATTAEYFVEATDNANFRMTVDGAVKTLRKTSSPATVYKLVGTEVETGEGKCGNYVLKTGYDKLYKSDDKFYVAGTSGVYMLLENGSLLEVVEATEGTQYTVQPHVFEITNTAKDSKGVVTGTAKCKYCAQTATVTNKSSAVPSGAKTTTVDGYILFWTEGTTSTTTTTTTTSPKTFDAGIAMYVGMALTSVAGSAVVIGKKKEF